MPEAAIPVRNRSGLHARPAAEFVREAARYACTTSVANLSRDPTRWVDATSILGILSIGVSPGHEIAIRTEGTDAERALQELQALVASGFGEPPA